jgi:thiamine biosynthesis lipoprotein
MSAGMRHFEVNAMATSFEIIIVETSEIDALYAAQAAEAAFAEIHRLEDELSRFRPGSDIWQLNQLKPGHSHRVSLATYDCLSLAKTMHEESGGAFDITIGPLMQLWRNEDGSLREPSQERLLLAKHSIGSGLFVLNEEDLSVTLKAEHMVFDLGAIGKGYALDQAAVTLNEWGIEHALLNAGDSTLLAMGKPPNEDAWIVTLAEGAQALSLKDRALSGSGFMVKGAHIMNPRTLRPMAIQEQRSYALAPSAALSDALSTAFMIMDREEVLTLCQQYAGQVEAIWI